MHSAHEAWATVYGELVEWFDEIRAHRRANAVTELIQTAAMCLRAAEDVYKVVEHEP